MVRAFIGWIITIDICRVDQRMLHIHGRRGQFLLKIGKRQRHDVVPVGLGKEGIGTDQPAPGRISSARAARVPFIPITALASNRPASSKARSAPSALASFMAPIRNRPLRTWRHDALFVSHSDTDVSQNSGVPSRSCLTMRCGLTRKRHIWRMLWNSGIVNGGRKSNA